MSCSVIEGEKAHLMNSSLQSQINLDLKQI